MNFVRRFNGFSIRKHNSSTLDLKSIPHLKNFLKKSPISIDKLNIDHSKPQLKFFIETYGCQMNVSDSEVLRSILLTNGHQECDQVESADLILTNTCAIRENAESKVWNRLDYFQSLRRKNKSLKKKMLSDPSQPMIPAWKLSRSFPLVGVLGCMAERLKTKLLDEESVDFVCGPDAYRDIPRLIDTSTSSDQKEANTQLSLEETYADLTPVRDTASSSAFVSIMRGCNNMCSFCIVPFTRGRERSRPMSSILNEIKNLVENEGVREIVLLGQNVNGFHDTSSESAEKYPTNTTYSVAEGFSNMFNSKQRSLPGARFVDLLAEVSKINPEVRVRFTSPHPKDFPEEVLSLIASTPNICKSLHLPFQSGSTSVLTRMRRGYSREAYLSLIQRARGLLGPNLTLSTDVITGFCGETEEEHQETLSLFQEVKFDQAFMFAYSLREKTHASHNYSDDISEEIKQRRLQEIISMHRSNLNQLSIQDVGKYELILMEGKAEKYSIENPIFTGRTDGNKRVVFPLPDVVFSSFENYLDHYPSISSSSSSSTLPPEIRFDFTINQQHSSSPLIPSTTTTTTSTSSSNSSSLTAADRLLAREEESKQKQRLKNQHIFHLNQVYSTHLRDFISSNENQMSSRINTIPSQSQTGPICEEFSNNSTDSDFQQQQLQGKYVVVRVVESNGSILRGIVLAKTTLSEFSTLMKTRVGLKN